MDARDVPEHAIATEIARASYGKLVAFLAATTRDVAGAEDALSEAFASALQHWPRTGAPDNPEGWLIAVARRKLIDAARRRRVGDDASDHLRLIADELAASDAGPIPDRRLALMFACAHPAIEPSIRAPLILQTLLGFDAAQIGSAFLVAPTTMGQRLARAKHKIRRAGIPFRMPEREDLPERLDAVLEAIYAAFAEGWSDPDNPRRRNLSVEAIWLGSLVANLLPGEPEALGLLALMLYSDARRAARRDDEGRYVPLARQDVARWDEASIARAEALLRAASALAIPGRFQIEAAIQSAHVVRRRTGRADWGAIEKLYDALLALTGSPVVAVNRAVAVAETQGPLRGLALLDEAAAGGRLDGYPSLWAARAELNARAGRAAEAAQAYQLAIGLESDPAVRAFLIGRRDALAAQPGGSPSNTA
jgi:RNA polymerase sigma-70 factor (ECF subfamily)